MSKWGRTLIRVVSCCAALVGVTVFVAACSRDKREVDLTMFQDATASSGLPAGSGMTHGAAWGDFNGDGRPDAYFTNHLNSAQLFRNLGGGRFENVTHDWLALEDVDRDKHGAAWADFNNDGRQDLVQLTGAKRGVGAEGKRLFRNDGTRLIDVAGPMGVSNPYGRTRMPLWLDLDNDGKLDLLQGAEARFDDRTPPFAFRQIDGGFQPAGDAITFASRSAPFCVVTNLTGNPRPDLVCRLEGPGTAVQMFDLSVTPAKVMSALPQTAFEDIAAADFDNDGRMDLFMARKNAPGAIALAQPAPQRVVASTAIGKGALDKPVGFRFKAQGLSLIHI